MPFEVTGVSQGVVIAKEGCQCFVADVSGEIPDKVETLFLGFRSHYKLEIVQVVQVPKTVEVI